MRRRADQEACGCDEVHGTQVSYDDAKQKVIILDAEEEDKEAQLETGRSLPQGVCPSASRDTERASSGERTGVGAYFAVKQQIRDKPAACNYEIGGHEREATAMDPGRSDDDISCPVRMASSAAESAVIDLTGSDCEAPLEHENEHQQPQGLEQDWICPLCTFRNKPWAQSCDMCTHQKT